MKLLCAELKLNCVCTVSLPHSFLHSVQRHCSSKDNTLDFRLQREIYIPIRNVAGNATSPYTTTFTVQIAAGYVDLTCDYISQEMRVSFWLLHKLRCSFSAEV